MLTYLLVSVAFIVFIGIVGYHVHMQLNNNVTKFLHCTKYVKRMIMRCCSSKFEHDKCDDGATSTSDEGSIDELIQNIERRHLLPNYILVRK